MKNRINLYSAVGMKCCHIAYHENHEGIFLVCGRQLTQWRGDDGKPLCKTCKRAARKPETLARRSNDKSSHTAGRRNKMPKYTTLGGTIDASDKSTGEAVLAATHGSADLDMMQEWASSLGARLPTIDLRHADIAIEWFYGYAKSHIKRAEELRAIEAVSKLSPPNDKISDGGH